jgi:hypothetical protein
MKVRFVDMTFTELTLNNKDATEEITSGCPSDIFVKASYGGERSAARKWIYRIF